MRSTCLLVLLFATFLPFVQGQAPCSITVSDVTALYNELGSPSTSTVVCIQPGTYTFPNQRTINRSVSFRGLGARPEEVVISIASGRLVLKNVILDGCTSTTQSQAAGLHLFGSNNVVMTDSVISNNQVWDYGAGMRIGSSSNVQLQNVTFLNNVASTSVSSNYGGAIGIVDASSTVTIISCTFTNNRAYSGGAIGTKAGISNSLSISKSTFTGNICAGSGWGHALSLGTLSTTQVVISDSTFNGNYAVSNVATSSIFVPDGSGAPLVLIYNVVATGQTSSNGFDNTDLGFGGIGKVSWTTDDAARLTVTQGSASWYTISPAAFCANSQAVPSWMINTVEECVLPSISAASLRSLSIASVSIVSASSVSQISVASVASVASASSAQYIASSSASAASATSVASAGSVASLKSVASVVSAASAESAQSVESESARSVESIVSIESGVSVESARSAASVASLSPTAKSSNNDSSSSIAPIIAGVVAAIVVLLILAVLALVYRRNKRRRAAKAANEDHAYGLQLNPLAKRPAAGQEYDTLKPQEYESLKPQEYDSLKPQAGAPTSQAYDTLAGPVDRPRTVHKATDGEYESLTHSDPTYADPRISRRPQASESITANPMYETPIPTTGDTYARLDKPVEYAETGKGSKSESTDYTSIASDWRGSKTPEAAYSIAGQADDVTYSIAHPGDVTYTTPDLQQPSQQQYADLSHETE
ncbi:hypothetical protein CAOG_03115 [Capsaspora owczarzaki ATCC 30864]|uniref:Right handed beta helix domain-containing protein n=1 Tax=Capsaspora owczarzaki (strain ATCC 30864) TaxID=595528 RepID=A0A0D2WNS0_CAPO3|nr:hypothetical protein CAOG_03115 [Capsaspora owczarzaki ATCC 30864]KJE92088.1 hypothetical protein CAOG_003115 [Capsaspora owczarzaki ATCC 30864]|eukprot:XP_004363954.2 hypothetical protein CAOG_03115 [Capsaspora owczarzaki ATCC 30864]